MKRLLSWFFGIVAFVALAWFALANRGRITVSFDPFTPAEPFWAVRAPVWAVFFAGIFLGLLVGGFAAWLKQGKWRRRARRAEYELGVERMSRADARKAAASDAAGAAPVLPAPEQR